MNIAGSCTRRKDWTGRCAAINIHNVQESAKEAPAVPVSMFKEVLTVICHELNGPLREAGEIYREISREERPHGKWRQRSSFEACFQIS